MPSRLTNNTLIFCGGIDADSCAEGVITVNPPRLFVKYGDSVEVNCSTPVPNIGMGWEATVGNKGIQEDVQLVTWSVEELKMWDVSAMCFVNAEETGQCFESLPVIVYSK